MLNNVIHRTILALKRLCFFSCFVHSCRKFDIVVMYELYPEKVHFYFRPVTGSPKAQDSKTQVFLSITFIMCTFAYLNIKYQCQTFKMKESNARYGFVPSQNWHKLISGPSFEWHLTKALSSPVPETWSCTFAWKRNVLGKMEIWNVAFNDSDWQIWR